MPELFECARNAQPGLQLGVSVQAEPQGGSEVVVLHLQPIKPGYLVGAFQMRFGLFGQGEEIVHLGAARGLFFVACC